MWPRLLNVILGVWLMVSPSVLGYGGPARISSLVVGPIAASLAVIAIQQATRSVRWGNLLLGLWLILSPWLLGYEPAAILNSLATGVLISVLASVRGKMTQQFGGGWSSLFK